jgi:hypothetical protein
LFGDSQVPRREGKMGVDRVVGCHELAGHQHRDGEPRQNGAGDGQHWAVGRQIQILPAQREDLADACASGEHQVNPGTVPDSPAPAQVTSHVTVAVTVNTPPGALADERV